MNEFRPDRVFVYNALSLNAKKRKEIRLQDSWQDRTLFECDFYNQDDPATINFWSVFHVFSFAHNY